MVTVFLSHASDDVDIAGQLAAELHNFGVRAWFASDALRVGENYAELIYDQLRAAEGVVILLSQASMRSPHVRREMCLAIDLHKMALPVALSPGIVGTTDMPVDWRYWLSIVQVVPFTAAAETAELISQQVNATAKTRDRRGVSKRLGNPDREQLIRTAVRASLIDAATEGRPFQVVLQRSRRLRCPRAKIEHFAHVFKATGLIDFDEPLEDATTLRLAT